MGETDFRKKYSFERRLLEADKIFTKYPNKLPIIVTESPEWVLDKHKYLVPQDLTVAQFIHVLRKRMKISSTTAIFLFVGNTLPASSTTLQCIYQTHKSADNFLYLSVRGENVFG